MPDFLAFLKEHQNKYMVFSITTELGLSSIQKIVIEETNLKQNALILDADNSEIEIDVRTIKELNYDEERDGYLIEGFGYSIIIANL